jgi:hypothetical protein
MTTLPPAMESALETIVSRLLSKAAEQQRALQQPAALPQMSPPRAVPQATVASPAQHESEIQGTWEVDSSIDTSSPDAQKLWSKQFRSKFKRSILEGFRKNNISSEKTFSSFSAQKRNNAIRYVLVECKLPKTFVGTLTLIMNRKLEQARATLARKLRGGLSLKDAIKIDADASGIASSSKRQQPPIVVKDESDTKRRRTVQVKPAKPHDPVSVDAPVSGMEVDLRTESGVTVGRARIVITDASRKNPMTQKVIGDGNVLVDVMSYVPAHAKYAIPFPAGSLPGLLCDVDGFTCWPLKNLSSAGKQCSFNFNPICLIPFPCRYR